jgi:hypothetical protein
VIRIFIEIQIFLAQIRVRRAKNKKELYVTEKCFYFNLSVGINERILRENFKVGRNGKMLKRLLGTELTASNGILSNLVLEIASLIGMIVRQSQGRVCCP